MGLRLFLQDLYYTVFQEHLFTSIGHLPTSLSTPLVKANYGARVWRKYPIFEAKDQSEMIFIHIPKCAGTSVANALGLNQIRHISASVFFLSDQERFSQARCFAVMRDPVERLASLLMHFRSSIFAEQREKAIFSKLSISEENIPNYIYRLSTDTTFRSKIFINTVAGRSGLSVSQADYLLYKDQLLVKNLFSLKRLDQLEIWLSEQLEREIRLPLSNSSSRNRQIDSETEPALVNSSVELFRDHVLYQTLMEAGGVLLEDNPRLRELEQKLKLPSSPPAEV